MDPSSLRSGALSRRIRQAPPASSSTSRLPVTGSPNPPLYKHPPSPSSRSSCPSLAPSSGSEFEAEAAAEPSIDASLSRVSTFVAARSGGEPAMGLIKAVVCDFLVTFMWMFSVSTLGAFTAFITSALQIQTVPFIVLVTTFLIFVIVLVFDIVSNIFGGAMFNPTALAAFNAAGLGNESLISMALRFPAQAAGAVGGALAISEVMPPNYKNMLGGPSLKVDLHTGAIAEGVLTFLITTAVLLIIVKGPRNSLVKTCLITICTVAMVLAGAGYTGPSMNPVNAFGWAYLNNSHNTWEHFYVYWICPFIGAIAAGWFFRVIFPKPAEKAKKA